MASFAGDESYWSSSAEATLGVTGAPQANGAGTEQPQAATDNTLLFAAVIVGVIVAIAIGLVNLLVARKRQ